MDKRIAVVVLFSLGVAACASYLVYAMLARRISASSAGMAQSIVAAHDLPAGSVIHEGDLNAMAVLSPVAGTVTAKEDIVGRGVTTGIYKGEPIVEARLSPKGAGGGLAGLIRPGMRAAAVRVNEVVGVSGFVRPGMHVDVITSGTLPDANQRNVGTVSRIVLQNIEVLSAGQDLDRDAEGKAVSVQVVNVLVTPDQAETLSLASEDKVQLILRNPLDTQIAQTHGTNTAAMFNMPETVAAPSRSVYRQTRATRQSVAPVAVSQPLPLSVEVVNGNKREMVTVGYAIPVAAGVAQE